MKLVYVAYLALMAAIVGTIAITPLMAMWGQDGLAGILYNGYAPTCHQWIYRSSCIFSDGNGYWAGDCIQKGKEALIKTEFTASEKRWDGVFQYSREQLGRNRAERVEYGNVVGYKFPVDTRSLGIYFSMLAAGAVLPFIWKKAFFPNKLVFLAGILPVAVDGTGQMFGLWESTNLVRLLAGLAAGATASVFVYAIVETWDKKPKKGGNKEGKSREEVD